MLYISIENPLTNEVIEKTSKVFTSTIITIIFSEHINAYLVSKMKIIFRGKYIGIRFVFSTFIATGVNLFLFCMMAFYGDISIESLGLIISSSWLYRFIIELMMVPISTRISNKLKIIEKTDIYDIKTSYSIFNLDTQYSKEKNNFT